LANLDKAGAEDLKKHAKEGADISHALSTYLANLRTILHLIQAQLQVLGDLKDIIQSNVPDAYEKGYNQNIVRLPLPLQEGKHNVIVMDALKMVIAERRGFEEQVRPLLKGARETQKDVSIPFGSGSGCVCD